MSAMPHEPSRLPAGGRLELVMPTRIRVRDDELRLTLNGFAIRAEPETMVVLSMVAERGHLALPARSGLDFLLQEGRWSRYLSFRGSVEAVNAALDGLVYQASPFSSGPVRLWLTVSHATPDLKVDSASGTLTVQVPGLSEEDLRDELFLIY